MTRLALLAVLLLALAPAVSRALSSGSTQVLAGWSELCTTMGLQLAPSQGSTLAGEPGPAQVPGGADDCAYCPLAASLPPLARPGLLLAALPRSGRVLVVPPPLRVVANLRGLGSRGPPILL